MGLGRDEVRVWIARILWELVSGNPFGKDSYYRRPVADERQPRFLKAKSPIFLQHETKLLDQGVEDLESDQ